MLKDDVASNKAIGSYGASVLQHLQKDSKRLSILTHCNTGRYFPPFLSSSFCYYHINKIILSLSPCPTFFWLYSIILFFQSRNSWIWHCPWCDPCRSYWRILRKSLLHWNPSIQSGDCLVWNCLYFIIFISIPFRTLSSVLALTNLPKESDFERITLLECWN